MTRTRKAALILAAAIAAHPGVLRADPPGRITGVGGIFFKSPNPKALAAWYRDVLGIHVEPWGGAMLRYDAPDHPPMVVWSPFPETTTEIAPSTRDFMINLGVDNMDAFLARIAAKGIKPISRTEDATGIFAAIMDPDGIKIELWQPIKK